MKKTFKVILISSFIFILLVLLLEYLDKEELETKSNLPNIINKQENIITHDYLVSVLACEMPASFPEEALKAGAIVARTFAYYKTYVENKPLTKSDQCFIDKDEMHNKWGQDYDKYYNIISKAVTDTENQVIYKDNKLLKTYYFSTSNGSTVSSMAVFGDSDIPSVTSSWDKLAKNYEVTTFISNETLINTFGNIPEIEIIKRDDTNHVEKVKVNNIELSGIEFRQKLGLRSTDFTFNKIDTGINFTTYGYGHGVGLSQYGASYMAKQGHTYNEILEHYYQNIQILKFGSINI